MFWRFLSVENQIRQKNEWIGIYYQNVPTELHKFSFSFRISVRKNVCKIEKILKTKMKYTFCPSLPEIKLSFTFWKIQYHVGGFILMNTDSFE